MTATTIRHSALMKGKGTWVQFRLSSGAELRGKVVVGTFDGFKFGTREVVRMKVGDISSIYMENIPRAKQMIEVFIEERATEEVLTPLRAFVEHLDSLNRYVRVRRSDYLVTWCEHQALWRWRFWNALTSWTRAALHLTPSV